MGLGRSSIHCAYGAAFAACCALALTPVAALAQLPPSASPAPSPSPAAGPSSGASPTPAPSPSASPRPAGLRFSLDAHTTFVTQTTNGPGTQPPEGPGFAAGSPLSPLTPYDALSSNPMTPGNASESGLYLTPTYYFKRFEVGALLDAGYVNGSVTNAIYWGEPLPPELNPHLGSQVLPYRIVFPTHAGQDDGTAFGAGVQSVRVATADENLQFRAGWFDLTQSDRFIFAQPQLSQAPPALAATPPESLGDGAPSLDSWSAANSFYPLHGLDLTAKQGLATLEASDAALPSLPGTGARLTMGSFVIDHGEGTRYSAQLLHLTTGGALVPTTILFAQGVLVATPQGMLPSTAIGGQQQTIFGVRAAGHLERALDGVVEYGHSTYNAANVVRPGTGKPGNSYHGGLTHALGKGKVSLDLYRNEPFYAQAILPYGIPENVWSVAWSWPGQWLKSNYQLIDNSVANINRQGYRLKYASGSGPLEVRAQYARFDQIVIGAI